MQFKNHPLAHFQPDSPLMHVDCSIISPTPSLPAGAQGGFLLDRALFAVLQDHRTRAATSPEHARTYPLPIILRGSEDPVSTDAPLHLATTLVPEWDEPAVFQEGRWRSSPSISSKPVRVLRVNDQVMAVPADAGWSDLWLSEPIRSLETFTPSGFEKQAFPAPLPVTSPMAEIVQAYTAYRAHEIRGPNHTPLRTAVQAARTASTLTPLTAFIVLENQAQEKMLSLKEQQKLSGPDALDFMESPEPELWILILASALMVIWHLKTQSSPLIYGRPKAKGTAGNT